MSGIHGRRNSDDVSNNEYFSVLLKSPTNSPVFFSPDSAGPITGLLSPNLPMGRPLVPESEKRRIIPPCFWKRICHEQIFGPPYNDHDYIGWKTSSYHRILVHAYHAIPPARDGMNVRMHRGDPQHPTEEVMIRPVHRGRLLRILVQDATNIGPTMRFHWQDDEFQDSATTLKEGHSELQDQPHQIRSMESEEKRSGYVQRFKETKE